MYGNTERNNFFCETHVTRAGRMVLQKQVRTSQIKITSAGREKQHKKHLENMYKVIRYRIE